MKEQGPDIQKSIEIALLMTKNRSGVFEMTKHYWRKIGKEFVTEPGFKVANLGSGIAVESIPFGLALEGKGRYDLAMTIRQKPKGPNVQIDNYELDPKKIDFAINDRLLRTYSSPPETYHREDIRNLSIPDESIDVCLLRHPNWNIDFPNDAPSVFREIKRVLKKGGISWTTHYLPEEIAIWSPTAKAVVPPNTPLRSASPNFGGVIRLNS